MWYYNMPLEAAAALAPYWIATDPYYYNYYQENSHIPYPPYYTYGYPYDTYDEYSYDPYNADTEYDDTSSTTTLAPEYIPDDVQNQTNIYSEPDKTTKDKSDSIGKLQAIRSVSNIHQVYNKDQEDTCSETEGEDERYATPTNQSPLDVESSKDVSNSEDESDSDTDVDDADEENDSDEGMLTADEHVPHQLSVIFEESDSPLIYQTDKTCDKMEKINIVNKVDNSPNIETASEGNDSEEEETVTVRLPLKLKFTKTEEDEDVTTVIVGDSLVVDSCNNISVTVSIPQPPSRQCTPNSVTEQFNIADNDSESDSDSSDEETYSDLDDVVSIQFTSSEPKENNNEGFSENDKVNLIEGEQYDQCLSYKNGEKYSYDDDEVDSGVTSQTDTESDYFNDMHKCGTYKRAATHSRLYRLLHGGKSDDEEDEEELQQHQIISKQYHRPISLPLNTCSRSSISDSFPSSGIASPDSTSPQRPGSTVPMSETDSGASTPSGVNYAQSWADYNCYYSSWDDKSRIYVPPTIFTTPHRTSPFPIAIPRCPMTPCPTGEGS